MKAWRLDFPFEWPVRKHQRQRMVHSRAVHPSTLTVLLPQIEADAQPDCWCGSPASLLVLKHRIDDCMDDSLSCDGDEIMFSCTVCVHGIQTLAAREIEDRLDMITQGEMLGCLSCGREITSLHDVLKKEEL